MSTAALFDKYYFSRPDFVDGTTWFHQICKEWIPVNGDILEIGAGPSNPTSAFLASLGRVTGVDVSDEVLANSAVTSACTYDGERLPFPDNSFDACVSNYVLEHVNAATVHFSEVRRILKRGGVYCFRTPNLFHYVTMVSYLTPHWFHKKLANALRDLPADAHDPYPTVYRSNTASALRRHCRANDMDLVRLWHVEAEPGYGRSHRLLFYPMLAYERIVNSVPLCEHLRSNLFGVARRS